MIVFFIIQLPQPGLKPLASEDCEVIDSLKCDTSSSSSAGKYKLSEKLLKNSQSTSLSNLPNSNEAFSWDIYKAPTGYNAPKDKPTDLFSGLSKDVKVWQKQSICFAMFTFRLS